MCFYGQTGWVHCLFGSGSSIECRKHILGAGVRNAAEGCLRGEGGRDLHAGLFSSVLHSRLPAMLLSTTLCARLIKTLAFSPVAASFISQLPVASVVLLVPSGGQARAVCTRNACGQWQWFSLCSFAWLKNRIILSLLCVLHLCRSSWSIKHN